MSWIQIEDNFAYNPKMIKAGPEATVLFIGGLCYANRDLTDGFILKELLPCIAPLPNPEELAKKLVDELFTPLSIMVPFTVLTSVKGIDAM
jgi:hypothetical protein